MKQSIFALSLLFFSTITVADVIFKDDFSPQQSGWSFNSPSNGFMGELNNNVNVSGVSLSINNNVNDPNASLVFDLLPIRSLDATAGIHNDTFSLAINGATIFSADFGANQAFNIHQNVNGASVSVNPGFFQITVPHTLIVGTNTYGFSYSPLQHLGDEAWGLDNVVITSSIPNPETLFLFGLGLVGIAGFKKTHRNKTLESMTS